MFDQSGAQAFRRGRRSAAGVAISISAHLALAVGALRIIQKAPGTLPRVMKPALTFIRVAPLPAARYKPEQQPLVLPEIDIETQPPQMARLITAQVPIVERRRPDVQPLVPGPVPREPQAARIEMLKPAHQVTVGTFAKSPAPSRTLNEADRQVDPAGFDAPAAQTIERTIKDRAVVGSFESAPARAARPGTDRPAGTLIADAGFGRLAVVAARAVPARAVPAREVGNAGFGSAGGQRPSSVPPNVHELKDSGFASPHETPATQPKTEPPAEQVEIPVEVLSKPTPTYTAEARQLKLEGEVSLEVEFCASGSVRVLRVVRGLGHGLDEAATQAAERIRFKPAQRRGRAVDFRTTVHITFRLT
jgi:TonB family protein